MSNRRKTRNTAQPKEQRYVISRKTIKRLIADPVWFARKYGHPIAEAMDVRAEALKLPLCRRAGHGCAKHSGFLPSRVLIGEELDEWLGLK